MILEVADIYVLEGHESAFVEAVQQGQHLLKATEGYIGHELQQCIEDPARFILFVKWETVEAHNVNFRESDRFPQWRGYIGEHFAKPPLVQHFEVRIP